MIGLSAYMDLDALYRLMGESETFTGFAVRVDRTRSEALFRHLKEFPRVATVASKVAMLQNFRETSARNVLYFTTILTAFASVIAIGVVYNNARIALSDAQPRPRDPARPRVHARRDLDVPARRARRASSRPRSRSGACSAPASWAIVASAHGHDLDPDRRSPRTYAFAALAIAFAGAASALIVRGRIDRLDLVGVLKTRE